MDVFTLLKRDIEEPLRPLVIILIISGLSSALLMGVVNAAAESVSNQELNKWYFALFVCIFALIVSSKRYVLDKSSTLVESILYKVRVRITNKIRHTELSTLEKLGTSTLYARLTGDITTIANLSSSIVNSIQSLVMIAFTLLYIAYISMWSFAVILIVLSLSAMYVSGKISALGEDWEQLSAKDTAFFEKLRHILEGFKEVKINRIKNEEVFEDFVDVNRDLKRTKLGINKQFNLILIMSQVCLFVLLGGLLFVMPQFHAEHSQVIFKVTASIIFIIGPLENVMASLDSLGKANVASRNVMELEAELEEELNKNNIVVETQERAESFESLSFRESISLKNLSYSYPPTKEREHIFTVGPIDLKLRKGELIFITGGNGSGKSTLLKLLTGLYAPQTGQIAIDADLDDKGGHVVTRTNIQQYRNLFSTIFFDFHLFDKLYGMQHIYPGLVNRILKNMELSENKVFFREGAFSNLNLSSGQKKRLALASNLLEDKPIYIFDEVAADLDPDFRDKYYYEILRELKERHKTVIVVSHDRHYWNVPDRIFEMVDGQIRELSDEDRKAMQQVAVAEV